MSLEKLIESDSRDFNPKFIRLYKPPINSHKGQNGKLLVIGGSKLFHSGIFWAADAASKIVDLVHLTSPSNENNQIFRKRLKEKFWNGIVVDWGEVESYIEEDDCILIGPGMVREERADVQFPRKKIDEPLIRWGKEDETGRIVNFLLKKYPTKKWVIDGGALQEVDVRLITKSCILTPHKKEFETVIKRTVKRPGLLKRPGLIRKYLRIAPYFLKVQRISFVRAKNVLKLKVVMLA